MATEPVPTFEYVIVGSGAGGGPLAARLAEAGHMVFLLEAGGDHGDRPAYQVPAFHGMATEDKNMEWAYFVRHYTDEAQQRLDSKYDAKKKGVWYPRAGTLGGCTAHNAMITVYPHNSDWDRIAELTKDDSWTSDQMRKYFERLESCEYMDPPGQANANPTRHGFHGWLKTSKADPKLAIEDPQLLRTIASAALAALMNHVANPQALAAHIVAKGNILLSNALGVMNKLFQKPLDPLGVTTALVDNALDFLGRLPDPNDWQFVKNSLEGLCIVPLAVDGGRDEPSQRGRRNGPREFVKKTQEQFPDKLIIETNALATRVLFDAEDKTKAVGVEYLKGEHLYRADPHANAQPGQLRQVLASREVILAAGAFNTPQLLLLSGIGPKDAVEKIKDQSGKPVIPCRLDLPGVGKNLQDRYEVGIISDLQAELEILNQAKFKAPEPGKEYDDALAIDPALKEWDQGGTGIYATNGAVIGIIMRSQPERPEPDLFIFGLPGYFKGYFQTYSQKTVERKDRFTWAILKAHTRNRAGSVTLQTPDPRDLPAINFRYFGDDDDHHEGAQEDLESLVEGVKFVKRMTGINRFITEKVTLPGEQDITFNDEVSDETIKKFIKKEAWGHHACGTCKIGSDDDKEAVLDSKFRVRGTKNLRIVDASVFPSIPGFFIVTAIYMIAEKASEVILADANP